MSSLATITQQIGEKNLAGQFHRFSRLLAQLSEHRWATDGHPTMRSGHVQLLRNLDSDGTRATLLAQRAQVTKQTMGRLVKELSLNGYVTLAPDPTDSRAQLVRLTARGTEFLTYLVTTLHDLESAFTRVLGEARLAEFTATLKQMTAFVDDRRQQLS